MKHLAFKHILISLLILLTLIIVLGAANAEDQENVLIAGCFYSNRENRIPCYWENKVRHQLSLGGNSEGVATCIGEYEGILYVAGFCVDPSGVEKPCYWRNGELTVLPMIVQGRNGQVRSMSYYQHDLYLAGFGLDAYCGVDRCYWRNNELVHWPLLPLETESTAYDIVIVNGIIYLCGYCIPAASGDWVVYLPCYWKDQKLVKLPTIPGIAHDAIPISMISVKNNLYFAGCLNPASTLPIPCFWKNEQIRILPHAETDNGGWAVSIAALDDNIYIAGYCRDKNGQIKPCFWENESLRLLPTIGPELNGWTKAVDVSKSNVYIAGYCQNENNKKVACYWKNGVRTDLSSPETGEESIANAIYVTN